MSLLGTLLKLRFLTAAKAGGKQTLVIGDEEGTLNFIDAEMENQWDQGQFRALPDLVAIMTLLLRIGTSHTSFQAHQNAIFDLAWSQDDQIIVRRARAALVSDVRLTDGIIRQRLVVIRLSDYSTSRLRRALGSSWATPAPSRTSLGIRAILVSPSGLLLWIRTDLLSAADLLSTASRDGSIRIWDRRSPGEGDDWVGSVNLIKNAHGSKGKASKGVSDNLVPHGEGCSLCRSARIEIGDQERDCCHLPSSGREPARVCGFL